MQSGPTLGLIAGGLALTLPARAGDIVFLDQIGGGVFNPTALSSSQFPPGRPESAITTVDNFTLQSPTFAGAPLRITRIEAAVAGLQNFVSFELIDSWTIQIYSSLDASTQSLFGDLHSESFGFPDALTDGFSSFGGMPVELATFDVDIVLDPGTYWLAVVMGNDFSLNGTSGLAGSAIGGGTAFFSGPGLGDSFPLGNPAAYRIIGTVIPGPGAALFLMWIPVARRGRSRVYGCSSL